MPIPSWDKHARVRELMSQNYKQWGFWVSDCGWNVYVHPANIAKTERLHAEHGHEGVKVHRWAPAPGTRGC